MTKFTHLVFYILIYYHSPGIVNYIFFCLHVTVHKKEIPYICSDLNYRLLMILDQQLIQTLKVPIDSTP